MKKEDIHTWVKALRSGKYKQGKKFLCRRVDGKDKFCCLGVAIDVLCDGEWEYAASSDETEGHWKFNGTTRRGVDFNGSGLPRMETLKEIGLKPSTAHLLADLNDGGRSFKEIASWIEKNLYRL